MRKIFAFLLLIMISFTLMSCTDNSDLSADETDLEVVDLQIIPELAHWLPQIAACAKEFLGWRSQPKAFLKVPWIWFLQT